jgi:hypothetical protein
MYLPFPIDDPSRTTSWTLGIKIRKIAYSLLRPGKNTTNEWTRRGPRIAERKIEHLLLEQVLKELQEWSNFIRPLMQTELSGNIKVVMWRLLGVYGVCRYLLDEERSLPGREVLCNVLSRGGGGSRDWNVVHFEAQVQAYLYSWRMVRQCVGVFVALREERISNRDADVDGVVDGISNILGAMPGVTGLCDEVVDEKTVEGAMERLYGMLGGKEQEGKEKEVEDDGFRDAKKRRRKRKKEELKSKLPASKTAKTPRAANLFDVLGIDR